MPGLENLLYASPSAKGICMWGLEDSSKDGAYVLHKEGSSKSIPSTTTQLGVTNPQQSSQTPNTTEHSTKTK